MPWPPCARHCFHFPCPHSCLATVSNRVPYSLQATQPRGRVVAVQPMSQCKPVWELGASVPCAPRPSPCSGGPRPLRCRPLAPSDASEVSGSDNRQSHFLFPFQGDQPWRRFERVVITSSSVGNGISRAHGRACGQQRGLGGTARSADSQEELLQAAQPLSGARLQTRGAGVCVGGCRYRDRKVELAASQCAEGWSSPDSCTNQSSLGPETPEY